MQLVNAEKNRSTCNIKVLDKNVYKTWFQLLFQLKYSYLKTWNHGIKSFEFARFLSENVYKMFLFCLNKFAAEGPQYFQKWAVRK